MEDNDPAADIDGVIDHVAFDRRSFFKRVAVTSAFAVPVVTSFSMSGVNSAFASGPLVSNVT